MSNDAETASPRAGLGEEEPLLGEQGDAQLEDGKPLYYNFILGTGVVAQAGAWIVCICQLQANVFMKHMLTDTHSSRQSFGDPSFRIN